MPQAPREYATELLAEARETHPWLHHRLFRKICDGELTRCAGEAGARKRT